MRALSVEELGFVSGGGTPLAQQAEQAAHDRLVAAGYVVVGEGGRYMQGPEGDILMTPRYASQVKDLKIDYVGVLRDLVNIGLSAATWEVSAAFLGGKAFVAWMVSASVNYGTTGHGH